MTELKAYGRTFRIGNGEGWHYVTELNYLGEKINHSLFEDSNFAWRWVRWRIEDLARAEREREERFNSEGV